MAEACLEEHPAMETALVTLAAYGPWGAAALALIVVIKLFIDKGYRIKLDVGPEAKQIKQ